MMMKWDGHTHTRFCKHSNPVEQELYIEEAIRQGFQRYTMSEHSPLPRQWVADESLMAELAMSLEELPRYFEYAARIKAQYAGVIEVAIGLELDYLAGAQPFSDAIVASWQHLLEDLVVSVHYLPGRGGMRCLDFTSADFAEGLLSYYGSMEAVAEEYYNHVEQAIRWGAGLPGRVRIGHINLIDKFMQALPPLDPAVQERRLRAIVPQLAGAGIGVDVNTAGMRVEACGRAYVPEWLVQECVQLGIPCVFGSDAHKPEQVGFGWDWYTAIMKGDL